MLTAWVLSAYVESRTGVTEVHEVRAWVLSAYVELFVVWNEELTRYRANRITQDYRYRHRQRSGSAAALLA
jgi:thiosulfate reductase cytochrome b subunit